MAIAALIAWIVTAGAGFTLLGLWFNRGGIQQQNAGTTSFRPGLIFGHFLLAAIGLVLWIVYVVADAEALTWVAVAILAVVAVLGFTMLVRWLGVRRGAPAPTAAPVGAEGESAAAASAADGGEPAERHLPVPVVALHGAVAVITVVLVLLTALGVGGE